MKPFEGFPARMELTAIPKLFFSALLPEITDMAELKTTLYVLPLLYRKRGYPRFVTRSELLGDAGLVSALGPLGKLEEVLQNALKMAAAHGTVIQVELDRDGTREDIYLLNTQADRQAAEKIRSGEIELKRLTPVASPEIIAPPPDIFTVYEQNIGVLTPMIAEDLRDAEKLYPDFWIRDAIKEAVALNKRNWRYVARILETWSAEGKSDGTHQRDNKEDPNKYIKGKYGHMVQR